MTTSRISLSNAILEGLFGNAIEDTDSYKLGHYLTYPADTRYVELYLESRGGIFDRTVFFGLQYITKTYLSTPLTHAMIDELKETAAWHGVAFNEAGFRRIVDEFDGRFPIAIRAVREGQVVPTHNVLAVITNTHPDFFWLPSYLETILMRVWYPITVCSTSWDIKQFLREQLRATSDRAEEELPFKLHDFGSRGTSSHESAAIGSMAHLVNFKGTDTLVGLKLARLVYQADKPGFSINATEHSSHITWGREGEFASYLNALRHFGKPGGLFACVSDSYDIYNAIERGWAGELKDALIASGATLVVRPDSGEPEVVALRCLALLEQGFGATINSKGYKVLNHVRLIWGDGMNRTTVRALVLAVRAAGYSIENMAFGMGGGLLQKVNRDDLKFAIKCCALNVGGVWQGVSKDPITDPGKMSKQGRQTLLRHKESGAFRSAHPDEAGIDGWVDVLHLVYQDGFVTKEYTFEDICARADVPIL
jgi:nicotinamide phosphoribosyltransferase